MDTSFPLDVGSPRIRFGSEMRRFREMAQLSQSAVAARLGCTQTQVSRLEIAKRTPARSNAEKLDTLFELTDKKHFVGIYHRILAEQGIRTWYLDWIHEVEPVAQVLRTWDPVLVPGLLQTEPYARAIFSQEPRITPEELADRVQSRIERQAVLDGEDAPTLLAQQDMPGRCHGHLHHRRAAWRRTRHHPYGFIGGRASFGGARSRRLHLEPL